jgi:hypothetical protein
MRPPKLQVIDVDRLRSDLGIAGWPRRMGILLVSLGIVAAILGLAFLCHHLPV